MTIGSLFSGIGGLELGLERAGLGPTIWQAEQDPYCLKVLEKHWPGARRYTDVRDIDANAERPDIICGGFPCQDISYAGDGAGLEGARSGLWFEFLRIIRELRPRWVVVENVAALLVRGLDAVLRSLAESGYDATWDCIPAAAVGAPHRRDRVFIVGHANGHGQPARAIDEEASGLPRVAEVSPAWPAPPRLRGVDDGIPHRAHRLRVLGNAVVPQVAEVIGRAIREAQ